MSLFRSGASLGKYGSGLLIACALVLPAAAADSGQDSASRQFQKTLPLAAGQTLSIENNLEKSGFTAKTPAKRSFPPPSFAGGVAIPG